MKGSIIWAAVALTAITVAAFVILEALGKDTVAYGAFITVSLAALLSGLFAAAKATEAKEAVAQSAATTATVAVQAAEQTAAVAETLAQVERNTNGVLSGPLAELVAEVQAMREWMDTHELASAAVVEELRQLRQGRHSAQTES